MQTQIQYITENMWTIVKIERRRHSRVFSTDENCNCNCTRVAQPIETKILYEFMHWYGVHRIDILTLPEPAKKCTEPNYVQAPQKHKSSHPCDATSSVVSERTHLESRARDTHTFLPFELELQFSCRCNTFDVGVFCQNTDTFKSKICEIFQRWAQFNWINGMHEAD